jgi:hypothetical protein
MTLIEFLRYRAEKSQRDWLNSPSTVMLLYEAANEIGRLNKELDGLQEELLGTPDMGEHS